MLGGLLFGIATFRAGILPRWAAGLLAVGTALTPAAALLPHALERLVAVPMGLALAWLGYALWSERREHAADPVPGQGKPPAPPNRSRVRSPETAWRGQAATRPLVSLRNSIVTRLRTTAGDDAAPPGPVLAERAVKRTPARRPSVQGAEHERDCLR